MTQQEAADGLRSGANNSSSEYIIVVREHLLIALGEEEAKPADGKDQQADISGQ